MRSYTAVFLLALSAAAAAGETVKLVATADIGLSDANEKERDTSCGRAGQFRLKTIQEMVAIRFDSSSIKGREVAKARLFLHRSGADMLRYIRLSTVNQNWEEGNSSRSYGPGDGATFNHADFASKRAWAWPGSQFCDVIMSAGNSLHAWAERKEGENGWISVEVAPELVYALAVGDTDGLAVQDGGTILLNNNMIHSNNQKGSEPYLEVELGPALTAKPAAPGVKAVPAPEYSHMTTGALRVTIEEGKDVFCWKLTLNGKPVDRWQVRHPAKKGPTTFILEWLEPAQKSDLEVVAVSAGGHASPAAKVSVTTSPALTDKMELAKLEQPKGGAPPPGPDGKMKVWALPGMVKISPEKPAAMFAEETTEDIRNINAVWNGKEIALHGCRGEYAAYQLCIEKLGDAPLTNVTIKPASLQGPGGSSIGGAEIELYKNWYAKNKPLAWQPAYNLPLAHGAAFEIPDAKRTGLEKQQNQTVCVDVYIPKDAKPGPYAGAISVEAEGVPAITLPIKLTVYDFVLPDKLSFWPELNSYNIPKNAHAYAKLAHQHRCVLNLWTWTPKLQGAGKDIKVVWDTYDSGAGALLSGDVFKDNRRAGVPQECMYLPYADSWPTPLTKQNYNYQGAWPGKGEKKEALNDHYLKSPYIGDALNQDYKDAFLAVQKQFIDHFKEKGWNKTEMQCFYQGKKTHRIDFGSNMWWTTDEPYHWDDWLALQFFCKLWVEGREAAGGDKKIWFARGDISRPNWQGRILDGLLDTQYGGIGTPAGSTRMRILARDTGVKINDYGSANADSTSNTGSVALLLNVWVAGGNAHLPWQTLGQDKSLDVNDAGVGGNALFAPGERFGLQVVGDMRLKALREAQQIIEYMVILGEKHKLTREQIGVMVQRIMPFTAGRKANAAADNADAMTFSTLQAWQLSELRRGLAKAIMGK